MNYLVWTIMILLVHVFDSYHFRFICIRFESQHRTQCTRYNNVRSHERSRSGSWKITFVARRDMCVQYVFFGSLSHFFSRVHGSSPTSFLLIVLYSTGQIAVHSDRREIIVWGRCRVPRYTVRPSRSQCMYITQCVLTFLLFFVTDARRTEIYRFIVWKTRRVCPGGSLRANTQHERTEGARSARGEGRTERRTKRTVLPSLRYSPKIDRDERIRHGIGREM